MRAKQDELFFVPVVHALEALSHAHRPAQRANFELQFLLNFIQQVECVFAFAVEFVDEHDNGRVAHPAHFH